MILDRETGLLHQPTSVKRTQGLLLHGLGGNSALPGAVQKHPIIEPRKTETPKIDPPRPHAVAESTSTSIKLLRGASRVARPLAVVTDTLALKSAYDQDGGFGDNFQETAGSVAGGWGGAAGGAMLGAAIGSVVPGVGTLAGGIVGGMVGGFVGSSTGSAIVRGVKGLFD